MGAKGVVVSLEDMEACNAELDRLRIQRDNLQFELQLLEATRLRDNAYLIERAEKAEKERDALKAQLSEQKRRTKYPFTAKGGGT